MIPENNKLIEIAGTRLKFQRNYEPKLRGLVETRTKQQNFEPAVSSNYYFEREDPYEYQRLNRLKEDVYDIIVNDIKTINIKSSRRKPSKVDFNRYFSVLAGKIDMIKFPISHLKFKQGFTHIGGFTAQLFSFSIV